MEITPSKPADTFILALAGRLDATWADAADTALAAAIRSGEHRIALDLAGVDYISSAGLRVIISAYKQLTAVHGRFTVQNPRPPVRSVIELSGLGTVLTTPEAAGAAAPCEPFTTPAATWEAYGRPAPVTVRPLGDGSAFSLAGGAAVTFPPERLAIGLGALAGSAADAAPHLGEFLAVAGCAVHLPAAEGHRPDFLLAEQSFVPAAWLANGLVADGEPRLLLRFEATPPVGRVPLAELAATALARSEAEAAAFVLVAETAGLVGASLRRPPAAEGDPFAFPGIRDWLSFTSERAHRDTTTVIVGFAARPGAALAPHLRPLADDLLVHAHAAVFPYRPIRKGDIALGETVRGLFDAGGLTAVLHLLRDTREPEGIGDSEFLRGALWAAPVR